MSAAATGSPRFGRTRAALGRHSDESPVQINFREPARVVSFLVAGTFLMAEIAAWSRAMWLSRLVATEINTDGPRGHALLLRPVAGSFHMSSQND